MPSLRILIVDDHALFRSGLGMLLRTGVEHSDICEARSLAEVHLIQRGAPDLILLDLQLQEGDAMEAIRPLKLKWPGTAIVVVSAHCTVENSQRALVLGCDAFISKTESPRYLLGVIRRILGSRQSDVPFGENNQGSGQGGEQCPLTARQSDVLNLINEGLTNRAIGVRLNVSENTVRAHVQAILAALRANSRTEAIVAGRRLGLLNQ